MATEEAAEKLTTAEATEAKPKETETEEAKATEARAALVWTGSDLHGGGASGDKGSDRRWRRRFGWRRRRERRKDFNGGDTQRTAKAQTVVR